MWVERVHWHGERKSLETCGMETGTLESAYDDWRSHGLRALGCGVWAESGGRLRAGPGALWHWVGGRWLVRRKMQQKGISLQGGSLGRGESQEAKVASYIK